MTTIRQLLPTPAAIADPDADPEATLERLADLYAYPDPVPATGWVRATMVSTLDGSATGADEKSGSISATGDRAVFSVLRGLADAIVVGAGTARTEGYRVPAAKPAFAARRARLGQQPVPLLAVLTRSGVLPPTLTGEDGRPALGVEALATDPPEAIAELAGRGLRRILLEGGPQILGQVAAASCLDELCLTLSPLLVGGGGPRILSGAPVELSLTAAHLLTADGLLVGRWLIDR